MELHPSTVDFAWTDSRDDRLQLLATAQRSAFDRDGFIVLRGALDPSLVQRVTAEIDALEAEAEAFLRTQPNEEVFIAKADAITFTVHIVRRSPLANEFSRHPLFLGLAHDLIGDDVRMYWDQAVYKKPEPEREFPWHQDNGYAFVEPQQYLTLWIPLTPATLGNGCPWLVPGVHRLGTLSHVMGTGGLQCLDRRDDVVGTAVPAEVVPGDVIAFSSLAPHRTGPNRTTEVRKAYILQYAPAGAEVLQHDGTRIPADDPQRQYPVLVAGHPVQPRRPAAT